MLVDTHCHIHESNYPLDIGDVLARSAHAGVGKLICVGTSEESSREAIAFATAHEHVVAAIGVHPHDTQDGWGDLGSILDQSTDVIAVGEIGLDYFYTHSPRDIQISALESQIDLALKHHLPIIFHVREAFDDFWSIIDNFHGVRGVIHSFTDTTEHLEQALQRGLYISVNGISTFTKDAAQKAMFTSIPLNRLLLETDAPLLTPVPFRGKVNEPAFVRNVAEYQASQRGISFDLIADATTANAKHLFAL